MTIKTIKCSSCGSSLNISKSSQQCKCSYCGTTNILPKKEVDSVVDTVKLFKRAAKFEGNGNDQKAMELYDKCLELEPQNAVFLFARALISLIDSPNDDFNMPLFQDYFDKAVKAMESKKMNTLDYLMYHFPKYTIPSMCVWQEYAYQKLCDYDKKTARKRLATNLLLLFDIQNKINDLVEESYFDEKSKSYIESYKNFKSSIINFGKKLLKYYAKYFRLKFGFKNKWKIRASIFNAQIS